MNDVYESNCPRSALFASFIIQSTSRGRATAVPHLYTDCVTVADPINTSTTLGTMTARLIDRYSWWT